MKYFMPAGLLVAFIVALLLPGPGQWLEQLGLVQWMVVVIFVINGYQTRLQGTAVASGYGRLVLSAILINLIIAPWIAWGVATLLPLGTALSVGILVMAAVPSTLSSAIVMTRIAGGDATASLMLTVILNLLGVFSIPLMLSGTLGTSGLVELSPWNLLYKLALLVLLPFVIGMLLRRWREWPVPAWVLGYLPSLCVIGTVWMLLSRSHQTLLSVAVNEVLWAALASLLVHSALLCLSYWAGKYHISEPAKRLALLFTASQKTLPVAISVMAAMAIGPLAGLALLCCIVFHFLQLLMDSVIAARLVAGSEH
ncbi:bile acid:sodium symporter [Aestuariirhabdus sp. Z084]|uniref:bile acid:sodium symporter n=1 Tax=Aestuariirhabdus haliotis TaxID=2918751 RepID=UPI00201B4463|nr:bile acid:sodium symporter [Aestuariirhabdus haliotis]MCL6416175.1 bile acid:sodium symporter [Aestuariirhabdus haliotis]MCL6420227.1 bile acid:sodium symporter [Aestuariirhabdus haliotis]